MYGMGQEIDQVINSLSKLREELSRIEYFEFDIFKIILNESRKLELVPESEIAEHSPN
jgi:hypothetical protein